MGGLIDSAAALGEGRLDLGSHLAALMTRIEEIDADLLAFLPGWEQGQAQPRPPLHGAAVAVKDIYRVAGLPTRAGSAAPLDDFEGPEAACVARLRAAGATILGKTVTTEFAWAEPGPTRNPLDPARTPGGSSSGSAAAVAAGLVPLALGSQTIGSVIRPAAYCGIVGFKPTYGRIPVEGILPAAPSVDTAGLFTVDVADAGLAASIVVDGWRESARRGDLRLGVPVGGYLDQTEPEALRVFEEHLGGTAVRLPVGDELLAAGVRHRRLVAAEFGRVHRHRFDRYAALLRPRTVALIREGLAIADAELTALRKSRLELRRRLHDWMDESNLDAWASPSASGIAPRGLGSTGSPALNAPWTHAGLPVITIPLGALQGLPLGLQLAGRFGADEELLELAGALESDSRAEEGETQRRKGAKGG